ncbi:hypothetical protein HMPREF1548_00091 [Clostridium sp. KLE 1755]|nr:hypothetical protein HMPREF1548_00091 [Clostridium sp. KLE 1755]
MRIRTFCIAMFKKICYYNSVTQQYLRCCNNRPFRPVFHFGASFRSKNP